MTSQLRTLMDSDSHILGTVFYMSTYNRSEPFLMWADSVELEYPCKTQAQDQPELFQNLQSFTDCLMKLLIRYNVLIDLDRFHNNLSSDYSLSMFLAPCTVFLRIVLTC